MKLNLYTAEREKISEGVFRVWLVDEKVGSRNFFIRAFEIEPGFSTEKDSHNYEHGIFILEGNGVAYIERDEILISKYDSFFIPPNFEHMIKNNGSEILRFICVVPSSYREVKK
ncbi:cupin domain-containing protein [Caldisericum sp.]|uniref:cupin domain-containing protein n=1 Tax=Caldisericum sp. TaxID=2499687 RepID=UPI003D0C0582